jgi:hypothetical protein
MEALSAIGAKSLGSEDPSYSNMQGHRHLL